MVLGEWGWDSGAESVGLGEFDWESGVDGRVGLGEWGWESGAGIV